MEVKAYDGSKMPIHGYGSWLSKPGEVEKGLEVALDAGYRLIDTALVYGNEKEIGGVLAKRFAAGTLKREEIFVTTKNWVTYFHPEEVEASLRGSLERLGLDYVDLYLLHAPCPMKRAETGPGFAMREDGTPIPADVDLAQTWAAMERLHKAGLAKQIGVSNFSLAQLQYICTKGSVKPHNHQLELHVYWPQEEMRAFCAKEGITVTSYATLGSPGRLSFQPPKGRKQIHWPNPGVTMEDPTVVQIAKAHGKTPAQVLLRWAMQHGIAVIPKSITPDRIRQNAQVFDFELSSADMKALDHLEIRQRLFLQDWARGHPQDPFKDERAAIDASKV